MAALQSEHRRTGEDRDSRTERFQRIFGPIAALIIGLTGIIGAVYLLDRDHGIAGFATLIGTLALLVSAMQGANIARKQRRGPPAIGDGQIDLFE